MSPAIRYSEAFKLEVVQEMEGGKFRTLQEAMEYYGIKGNNTIQYWLRKYGKDHLIPKIVRVESVKEKDQVKELQKEIKLLKKALAETRVSQVMAESYFKAFCQEFGITDVEDLKKKLDAKLSKSD